MTDVDTTQTTTPPTPSAYEIDCQRRKEALDAIEERLFKIAVQIAVVEFETNRTMDEYHATIANLDAARAKRLDAASAQDATRA